MVRTSTSGSSGRALVRTVSAFVALLAIATSLPAVLGQDADDDRGRVLGDKKCFLCHSEQKEAFPKTIHGDLMTGDDSITCEVCHGPGERHMASMGETKFIIRFGELSPEAASRRCLKCHEKTAKAGGHIDGFLSSSYLSRGMGCTSCHQAHAPKAGAAPAAAPKTPKTVGTEACLVCHSDRAGLVRFPHRERVEDMLGCETCHGPGREHALARGKGPIRNPAKLEPARADVSCLLCHSAMKAPEHFKPEPGKEKCADCHVIHPALRIGTPTQAEPGRPPFALEGTASAPPSPVERRPFPSAGLAAVPAGGTELLGVRLTGDVRGGARILSVNGNEKVYDQDQNYDRGFRIFDLSLAGELVESPGTRFSLTAEAIDDPVEVYGLTVEHGDLLSLKARAKRQNFVYHATGDPQDESATKDDYSFDLTVAPEGELRFGAGLDLWYRDGDRLGQRMLTNSPTASREPIDEAGWYGYLRIEYAHGPLTASLTQGYRSERLESGIEAGAAVAPASRYLFYRQETDLSAPVTTLLGSFTPSGTITVDGKLVWSPIDTDTDSTSRETGPSGGSSYLEQVFGTADGERTALRAEIGATWLATEDLSFSGRIEHMLSLQTVKSSVKTRRSSPPAAAPTVTTKREDVDRDHRLWRFGLEGAYRFADWIAARAGAEYTYMELARNYELENDQFYDANSFGPLVGIDLDPTDDLSIEGLYRFVHVSEPFVPIGEENTNHAKLRVRWGATPDLDVAAHLSERSVENGVHDTEIDSRSFGLTGTLRAGAGLTLDLGFSFEEFETETDALRFLAGTPVLGRSEFDGSTREVHAFATWFAADALDLSAGITYSKTTGDFPLRVWDLSFGAEYEFLRNLSLGTDLHYLSYDEDDANVDDYDAFRAELWLRLRF